MTRFPKIVALLGFLVAAGCRDSYPGVVPPEGIVYYPVGLAVRQVAPSAEPGKEYGATQLVVVSSNFDIRYEEPDGGTVQIADPDASPDTSTGQPMTLYPGGFIRTASFGGKVAVAEAACQPGWPLCPSGCSQLAADPAVAAGGAKVLFTSRSSQFLYDLDLSPEGALSCNGNCVMQQGVELLDPYGVALVCNSSGGTDRAQAMFTYLNGPNGQGWLTRLDLLTGTYTTLAVGQPPTFNIAYDPAGDRVYFTGKVVLTYAPIRWFNPSIANQVSGGYEYPPFSSISTTTSVLGSVATAIGVSNDRQRLYVSLVLYDADLFANTGSLYSMGGALAVFSLTPNASFQPSLALLQLVPTCAGSGDLSVLPARPGKGDLVAMTCDQQGTLVLYDDDLGGIIRFVGLDPATGLPALGLSPFGIASEPIDPRRAIKTPASPAYGVSPCVEGGRCTRLYVGAFMDNWINVLELDPDQPASMTLVKRIGRGP